jgi:hypothetical protein
VAVPGDGIVTGRRQVIIVVRVLVASHEISICHYRRMMILMVIDMHMRMRRAAGTRVGLDGTNQSRRLVVGNL